MTRKTVNLLRHTKQLERLCKWLNRDMGCRDAYLCRNNVCPLEIARNVQVLCDRGQRLSEAYRSTVTSCLDHSAGFRIIQEALAQPRRDYPEPANREEVLRVFAPLLTSDPDPSAIHALGVILRFVRGELDEA